MHMQLLGSTLWPLDYLNIVYYLKTSLDYNLLIHVSISFFPFSMIYIHPLILTHHMMLENFLDISKLFIGYDIHDELKCDIEGKLLRLTQSFLKNRY